MRVLVVTNVEEALVKSFSILDQHGCRRDSRNGPVIMHDGPVTTVYCHPWERVVFNPIRDANPFFHLYESLWMLSGRNDVEPLARYAKQMLEYSDNGATLHSAYGFRWRRHFKVDQLGLIAGRLQRDKNDRRCMLQIWDVNQDLDATSKDLPCNTMVTFQINLKGQLDIVVFNRSNDIIWGAYGANAVQFSFLQEYMAAWIGVPIGTYSQVSVNWHAYLDTLKKVEGAAMTGFDRYRLNSNGRVSWVPMLSAGEHVNTLDYRISHLLAHADSDFQHQVDTALLANNWFDVVYCTFWAHSAWRNLRGMENRYTTALKRLDCCKTPNADWIVAAREWLLRRQAKETK